LIDGHRNSDFAGGPSFTAPESDLKREAMDAA
jgi:hypothetical protein